MVEPSRGSKEWWRNEPNLLIFIEKSKGVKKYWGKDLNAFPPFEKRRTLSFPAIRTTRLSFDMDETASASPAKN